MTQVSLSLERGQSSEKTISIVVFHGFNQNPDDFYRSIVKIFPKSINNTPVVLNIVQGGVTLPTGNRAYWYYNPEDSMKMEWSSEKVKIGLGLEKSIEALKTVDSRVIMIGFSQGGMFLDHIIKTGVLKPIGAIFLCTRPSPLLPSGPDKMDTPSLHIYGEKDGLIHPEESLELSTHYKNPEVFSHPGKHVIPNNSFMRSTIRKFLGDLLK